MVLLKEHVYPLVDPGIDDAFLPCNKLGMPKDNLTDGPAVHAPVGFEQGKAEFFRLCGEG